LTDNSGAPGKMINIWAYPGEKPIINYSDQTFTKQMFGMYLHNINYIHFKGIRITSIAQTNDYTIHYGIILYNDVSNCIFEQMETDHIGGWGVVLADNCNNNLFLNCDSHHNADPYSSDSYGGSDGFETGSHTPGRTSTNNTFRGCRSWSNSDDGWDLRQADGVYYIENCWSFNNGFIPDTTTEGGNGVGFKLGGKTDPGTNSILRTISNSLAFGNRGSGFDPEPDDANKVLGVVMYNCMAYNNAREWGDGFSVGGYNNPTTIKNCIDYNNYDHAPDLNSANVIHDHNSFDLPVTVSDADFLSVNSAGADGPRNADGSLPNLKFLHLKSTSGLIDAGVNVGLPYNGKAPDLGAFETN